MKVGDRVTVRPNQKDWNRSAFEALNGQSGVIVEVKSAHDNGRELVPHAPRFLVQLDTPPRAWGGSPCPTDEWWFEEHEMEGAS